MTKKIFFILFLAISLNASMNQKVKNLLGPTAYKKHKNLIDYITANNSSYIGVIQELKNNGLLKLKVNSYQYASFKLKGNSVKNMTIIKNSLKSIGYYHVYTMNLNVKDTDVTWNVKIKTDMAVDPVNFAHALRKRKANITDIIKTGFSTYHYKINMSNAEIYSANSLVASSELLLKKPLKPYMIKVADASSILIQSNIGNRWHPVVVFYDSDFNILETLKEDSKQTDLQLDVPVDASYIKIDDLYSLSNLKRGMKITKE